MPVVITQNPAFPSQVGPNGTQAFVQQLNFRQIINEICAWNPNMDSMWAGRTANNWYRRIINKRQWYALKVRGNINIPTITTQGTCTITNGSNVVQGIGTNWTNNLIGFQFRAGFTFPWATINNVNATLQQLTIDTPFGGNTITGGFQIQSVYITMGANVTYLLWAVNQQQGWPMEVNVPVETINSFDPWRQSLGWSTILATRPPTPSGVFQVEVWPTPYQAQVFPFEAYTQPADMALDIDSPASFINADLIVTRSIADALLFGGRSSKYYDPTTAAAKVMQYKEDLEAMENADNALDQRDVSWDYGQENGRVGFGPGSTFCQSHDAW
jgi:hypothetical protein